MTLSSTATSNVDEVASTGHGIRFFQLYVLKDRDVVVQLVRRAERARFKAIVLTMDSPFLGRKEADIKNRLKNICKCQWEQSFYKTLHESSLIMVEYILLVCLIYIATKPGIEEL
ncbi:hypothetical protein Fmac_004671 [Flemingia macrophylla]|uniref:FMN hydroxy acid dehydrogenase domain-containing protein n=1 Tax=Flemingia macrophylla TaxID=520843 RepID=A0ABD1N5M6_9FABA